MASRQSRDALQRRPHLTSTLKEEIEDIHWVEKSGRAFQAVKKDMLRHRGVKGHGKVEETVQDL